MQEIILEIIDKFGYLGVLLLIAAENIFPPIPSEIILTFGGFATTLDNNLNYIGMLLFSTLGSLIGAIVLYSIGSFFGKEKIFVLVDKYGRILKLNRSDIEKAESWFIKNGNSTVFFCRFIPLIRSLISIPAGMSKMNIIPFVLLTTLGSAIWNAILIYVGMKLGENWDLVLSYMDLYSNVTYILLALLFFFLLFKFYINKTKKQKDNI